MKNIFRILAITTVLLGASIPAQALLIGGGATSSNSFPFGGDGPGTRYQQVYSSSQFSGPLSISGINFFQSNNPGGNLASGTFEFHFSTTTTNVDALDTSNLNNNVGANDQLFTTTNLTGGAAPSTLSFTGTTFGYDPSQGNLLLDIFISGYTQVGSNAFYDSFSGNAGGIFSRAHDFGSSFAGYGLSTEFITTAAPVPVPAAVWLMGSALFGLAGFRRNNKKLG